MGNEPVAEAVHPPTDTPLGWIVNVPCVLIFLGLFQDYDRLLITTWGHDPSVVPVSNVLVALNDALSHSAVLIQVFVFFLFLPFSLCSPHLTLRLFHRLTID